MGARTIFVASSGGHLAELVQLRSTLLDQPTEATANGTAKDGATTEVTWVTFDCAQSRSLLAEEPNVIYVPHVETRGYTALLRSFLPALRIMWQVRPHRVYSTGAAIALAFLPFAFFFGARATYIESATRVHGPSVTGRLLSLFPWVRLRTQYRGWARGRWKYDTSVFEELTAREVNAPSARPVRRVVVTLGTQPKYPFVSLVQRLREIVPGDVEVLWQIGPDFPEAARPEGAHDYVPKSELQKWIGSADVVIAHGGVGSALSALRAGHKPVLVARRQSAGEHVDDHQQELVDELAERHLAVAATPADLTWEKILDASRSVVEAAPAGDQLPAADKATDRDIRVFPSIAVKTKHTTGRRLRRKVIVVASAIATVFGLTAFNNSADGVGVAVSQSTMPTAVPSKATPNIQNGVVYAINQVGGLIFTGGSFTSADDPGSTTAVTRTDVLAFDASTGKMSTTFAPTLDGIVEAIAPGPVPNTVYLAGFFNTVNGVKSKGITLLSTQTGAIVSGFKPPALNGVVYTIASANGHLLLGGSFTLAGASARNGLASLNPTTGALDSYLTTAMTGHHNYNGSGANGPVGPRAMAVNPTGTRLFVLGNFKNADGVQHDQAAMIDLTSTSATLDANWNTLRYTAKCAYTAFDTYVSDVQWSPDGSYFVIVATGGSTMSTNTDGTRSLCDAASRWEATSTGTNVQPTWVDYTGQDTFWSVAISGSAIYAGGHERWVNNDSGTDNAKAGAIPRPGMVALDPLSGMPLTWNPGRNPRGAGAYAMFVNAGGLYVGSDTDYFGNFEYKRMKIGYFPLSGGYKPAPTTTASLPANVYVAGPLTPDSGFSTNDIYYRAFDGSAAGATTGGVTTGQAWSGARGIFAVGDTVFFGTTAGNLYRATFNGTTLGSPVLVDPYDDPKWDSVKTGSGTGLYQGAKPTYYSSMSSLTGAFYANGRLFYTLSGSSSLYWRGFSPDSGAIGSSQFTATSAAGVSFSNVAGMFGSGNSIYYAASSDGSLHRVTLNGTALVAGSDIVVSGPTTDGKNWRARGLFTYGSTANQPPVASATSSCSGLTCSFNGSASHDPDGTVAGYSWNFGDGTTGTGVNAQHAYTAAGSYTVTLTVTDNAGAQSTAWSGQVSPSATSTAIGFVGAAGTSVPASSVKASTSVTVPAGTQAGNTELLYVSANTTGVTTTAPAGFTQIARETNSPMETTVYSRTAVAADAGSTVPVQFSSAIASDVRLAVYSGVGSASATVGGDANTATHVTPVATTTTAASWIVSYWSVRTSTASTWTAPSGVTTRSTGVSSGGGHIDSLLADNGPVSNGSYGGLSASSGATAGKGAMVTIVLAPSA